MDEYQGKKWRPTDDVEYKYDFYSDSMVGETVFRMTKGYSKYCQERQREKELKDILETKRRLKYEYETHGEVDKIDVEYLLRKVQLYNKQYNERIIANI